MEMAGAAGISFRHAPGLLAAFIADAFSQHFPCIGLSIGAQAIMQKAAVVRADNQVQIARRRCHQRAATMIVAPLWANRRDRLDVALRGHGCELILALRIEKRCTPPSIV